MTKGNKKIHHRKSMPDFTLSRQKVSFFSCFVYENLYVYIRGV